MSGLGIMRRARHGGFVSCLLLGMQVVFAQTPPANDHGDLDVTMHVIVDPNAKVPDEIVRKIPLPAPETNKPAGAGKSDKPADKPSEPKKPDKPAPAGGKDAPPPPAPVEQGRELGEEVSKQAKERAEDARRDKKPPPPAPPANPPGPKPKPDR